MKFKISEVNSQPNVHGIGDFAVGFFICLFIYMTEETLNKKANREFQIKNKSFSTIQ